jgi:hypothetical protein
VPFLIARCIRGGARGHRLVELVDDDDLAHVSTVGGHEAEPPAASGRWLRPARRGSRAWAALGGYPDPSAGVRARRPRTPIGSRRPAATRPGDGTGWSPPPPCSPGTAASSAASGARQPSAPAALRLPITHPPRSPARSRGQRPRHDGPP